MRKEKSIKDIEGILQEIGLEIDKHGVRGSFGDAFSSRVHMAHFIDLWGIFYRDADES